MSTGIQGAGAVGSLYIHVPFCARKCDYCAFYSERSSGALIERYLSALLRELEAVTIAGLPRTIFFGGGTPSLLSLEQWQRIFAAAGRLGLLGAEEWTIECNPATVSLDKARLWRAHGVNRVSMGVQSLDERLLDRLGRVHSRAMVFKSFDILRQAGFDNINIDLMFAIPGQTLAVWQATLAEATALASEHLSAYEVTYEEDTPLYDDLQAGKISVDDERACVMYEALLECASAKGLVQYEISNFAKTDSSAGPVDPEKSIPARACRHNINYWQGGAYYGLGPSAAGYVGGARTKNWSNTTIYCEQLERGQPAVEWRETLPSISRAGEMLAFGLRMNAGWNHERFQTLTGYDVRREWGREVNELVSCGWAEVDEQGFRLTRQGLRFADSAAELVLR